MADVLPSDGSVPENPFVDDSCDPPVRGFLHRLSPATRPHAFINLGESSILVLTHGAGSDARAPLLVALARAFALNGCTVLRCDLPFRQQRKHGPPFGTATTDRQGLRNAVAAVKRLGTAGQGAIFLGGHSYGGRQASILAASEPDLVGGLLLLSYPLHPPDRPSQSRTAHFPELRVPALFVHGSRDPFGSLEEVEAALKLISAPTSLLPVEGAGHDLAFRRRGNQPDGLPSQVALAFAAFMAPLASTSSAGVADPPAGS
ncbi:MAG TPA: alpha/beta fold hydrolase, partial [Terriglobia bacterium]|nr:alpha/beta fold hydrolase [Terriglobia bacterium]